MAAIDGQRCAGDEAARLRAHQQQRRVQLFQPAKPALGNAPDQRLPGIGGEEVPVQLGLEIAGAERVDADAVASPFQRQAFVSCTTAALEAA